MKIREANKKDLPHLRRFCLEAHKELAQFSKDMTVNEQTEKMISQEVNAGFKDPFTKIFVAEKDSKIIGNVYIFFASGLRMEGTIFNLFIIKSQRKKGIASKLIIQAIKWLKEQGIKRIRMVVHKKNKTALLFLRKLGFRKEPTTVFWLTKSI